MFSMTFINNIPAGVIALVLMGLTVGFAWLGHLWRQAILKRKPEREEAPLGGLEAALLGLLALLLAFTFSLVQMRYEDRRQAVIEEANCIGTAFLRTEMYPEPERTGFRMDFKEYIEARISFLDAKRDWQKINDSLKRASEISGRLFQRAARLSQDPKNLAASNQMIPALNNMIDIVTVRNASLVARVPGPIIRLLLYLTIITGFILGYGFKITKSMDWGMVLIYAIFTSLVIFVILDMDRPMRGFITLENVNQFIDALRQLPRTP